MYVCIYLDGPGSFQLFERVDLDLVFPRDDINIGFVLENVVGAYFLIL